MDVVPGVSLSVNEIGNWIVRYRGSVLSLADADEMFRLWALLEQSPGEVIHEIDRMAIVLGAHSGFPFRKLVDSALRSRSSRQVDVAIKWLPYLSKSDVALLPLEGIVRSKWASQHARHVARKYLNQRH